MSEDKVSRASYLEKLLDRYDHYIATTNTKASIVITLATFIVGGVVLVLVNFDEPGCGTALALTLVLGLIGISVASAASVVYPRLNTSEEQGNENYQSLIFFGAVAERGREEYVEEVVRIEEKNLVEDAAIQVHVLANVANKKFKKLQISYICLFAGFFVFLLSVGGLLWLK